MAPAKFEKILSISSEDPAFPAENLLKNAYSGKKWKCKTAGEKQISVTIQLEKAERITAVDVGNYGSAFVEILVSKSSAPDEFKVLIVASSLMTLQDSKLGVNLSNVRFFKEDSIAPDVTSEKWDRIKVVCSQPYNKQIQYGLSFLVVHVASGDPTHNKDTLNIGNFQLKKKESAENISIGSLFAKRKKSPNREASGAAAIRVASTTGVIEKKVTTKVTPRPSDSECDDKKDGNDRPPVLRKKNSEDQKKVKPPQSKHHDVPRTDTRNSELPAVNRRPKTPRDDSSERSRKKPPPVHRSEKPFNRLLEGVIFTISGFQNPYRSELRSKAIQMGAKYRPDWDSTCTHLICAFPNTPKFIQVLGLGKIVTKEWVENCYNRRVRIPWRRHALHPPDKAAHESEEEIFELVERPPSPVDNRRRLSAGSSSGANTDDEIERVLARQKLAVAKKKDEDNQTPKPKNITNNDCAGLNASNEADDNKPTKVLPKEKHEQKNNSISSKDKKSSEINKTEVSPVNNKRHTPDDKVKKSPSKKKSKVSANEQPEETYDMDTEEEDEPDSKKFDLPVLPAFFEGLAFHVCNDLGEDELREVRRYILAHKGSIVEEDDLNAKEINYLITVSQEKLKKVKHINAKVIVVRPEWIWKSHDESRIAPTKLFEIN